MAIRSQQLARVKRKNWKSANELAKEVSLALRARKLSRRLPGVLSSRQLAPNVLQRKPGTALTLTFAGTYYDLIGEAMSLEIQRNTFLIIIQTTGLTVAGGSSNFVTHKVEVTGPVNKTNEEFIVYGVALEDHSSYVYGIAVTPGTYGFKWSAKGSFNGSNSRANREFIVIPFSYDNANTQTAP